MFFRNDGPPKPPRELLASIAGELKASADCSGRGALSQRTVKELLIDLVGLVRGTKAQKEQSTWLAEMAERSTLAFFCFLCIGAILASASAHSDIEFFEENRVFIRTLGISMSAIYIGIAVEKMGVVALLWRYNVAKFIVSLAVSVLVVFSAGKASSVINGVFGIDAGAFPYARALLAGWIAFSMAAKPLLWLVGVLGLYHFAATAMWFWTKYLSNDQKRTVSDFPWGSVGFVFLSMILVGDASRWFYRSLSADQAPAKVYQLARMLDFNGRHQCANLKGPIAVVYIGPEQRRVLVDDRPEPAPTFGAFIMEPVHAWETLPDALRVEECQMVRSLQVPAISP